MAEPLRQVLEAGAGDIREKAAMALGDIGDERSVNPLIYALGKDGEKVEVIKEILKGDEKVFTCPYCQGRGSVKGWSSNPKGSIAYTGSKHKCSQCEGTGELRAIVEGKLKIEITKLPLVPLFTIKAKINLFHKEGGPANVETVLTLDWGEINIENTEYFGKMGHTLNNKKHLLKKYSRFMIQKNAKPRIDFDIYLSTPDVTW